MTRILNVGNCAPDHSMITQLLKQHFNADVVQAHNHDEALTILRSNQEFDLVLVNRLMDASGAPGIRIITSIKQDAQLNKIPVMMLTNFEQHQNSAMAEGAIPGFGKLALDDPATIELLRNTLAH